ncbi:MAG TPA: OmpA family protein [Ignavibacteriaceae bacterium]|nr:OmpA family protein [Ignavibacteriaceae bacterium]
MNKILLLLTIFLSVLSNIPLNAQFKDWSNKIGIRGSILLPENEFANFGFSGNDDFSFNWFKFSYTGEAFFGFKVSKVTELQLNLGLGIYSGKAYFDDPDESFGEYKSTLIPVNLRLRVSPWDIPEWNPYFYLGSGVMGFDLSEIRSPNVGGEHTDNAGWCGIFLLGVGAEFALSNNILFDVSLGSTFSTSHELDGYKSGDNGIGDYYLNLGVGLSFISESCDSDKDGDGIGRCDEQKSGTDPHNPDTDNDGLSDGDEMLIYKTNPLKSDTDGDFLSDFDELFTYKTDPLNADTDGDGLSDGDEVLDYTTDPLKTDSDSDDLTDSDEVHIYKTLPTRSDTDGDGLSDGGELHIYYNNPLNPDSDGDGLSDGDEVINYGTDPNNRDTDGGTVSDFHEVRRGTDPFNANDDIIKIDVPIVLEGIMFAKEKSDITPESEIILQGALETLKTYTDIIVEISGHTDNIGSNEQNMALSQRRADSVRFWLIQKGIEPDRIIAKGYGEDFPRVPNDSRENRSLNRRIEFKRIK